MTIKRNSAGSWVSAAAVKRRAAGAWTDVANVKKKVAGAWAQVWPNSVPNLTLSVVESTAGVAASMMFNTDGTMTISEDGVDTTLNTQWLNPSPSVDGALYEIRRTQVSGTLGVTFTGTFSSDVWYPMTSQRGITVVAGGANRNNSSNYSIRRASDGVVLVADVNIQVSSLI